MRKRREIEKYKEQRNKNQSFQFVGCIQSRGGSGVSFGLLAAVMTGDTASLNTARRDSKFMDDVTLPLPVTL